jgi:hypothetical protein
MRSGGAEKDRPGCAYETVAGKHDFRASAGTLPENDHANDPSEAVLEIGTFVGYSALCFAEGL